MAARGFDGPLWLACVAVGCVSCHAADVRIDERFDGPLDERVWEDLTDDGAVSSVSDGAFRAVRAKPQSAGLRARPARALAPAKGSVLRLLIEFSPEGSFTTKNNFFLGVQDQAGGNSVLVQSGREYGWGGWGVVVTSDGRQQKGPQLSVLNGLPRGKWMFELRPSRVRVLFGAEQPDRLYFDSRRQAPEGGGTWSLPTAPMLPVVLDRGSTGLGPIVIDRIRFGLEPLCDPVHLLPGNGRDGPLILASDGKARATIVVSDTAPAEVGVAARDLLEAIRQATGAVLPILEESDPVEGPRVLVGNSGAVEELGVRVPAGVRFRDEGVLLQRVGRDLVIAGNDEGPYAGTQDAVVRFLNVALGADFFYAAPSGKVVPKRQRLAIEELALRERPAHPCRGIALYRAKPERRALLNEWLRWSHSGGAHIEHRHAHMMIAPPDTYFADHPEYYSFLNGKRSVDGAWQLCTTNADVVALAVRRGRKVLNGLPAGAEAAFSVSFNDGGGTCRCPECRKLDAPDPIAGGTRRILALANAAARELAKTDPAKGVAFYAYLDTLHPPADGPCEPNVIPVLADSANCVFHSFHDNACGLARDAKSRLIQWARVSAQVKLYDYYGLYGDYMGLPFCNLRRTIDNARFLRSLDGLGFWYDAVFVPGPQGLHYWTAMRCLWDAELTVESARKQFCDGLYGRASGAMQGYYRHLEEVCTGAGIHSVHVTWVVPGPLRVWTEGAFATLNSDLARARSLVAPGSPEEARIDEQGLLLRFARVFVDLKHVHCAYRREATESGRNEYARLRLEYVRLYEEASEKGLMDLGQRVLDAYAPGDPAPSETTLKLRPTPFPPDADPLPHGDPAWVDRGHHVSSLADEDGFLAYPKTELWLTHDDHALYVRANCHDYHMADVKARAEQDGDLWEDDCVRLAVVLPDSAGESARHDFYVNAEGVQRDERNGDVQWNATWRARSDRSDRLGLRQWAVRMEIPWGTLGLSGPPAVLKANFFRRVTTETPTPVQSLSPTFGPLGRVERYATVTLEGGR